MSAPAAETLVAADGWVLRMYAWLPATPVRAIVQVAHGMGEHARRYGELACYLNDAGIAVYANDHRGHGESASQGRLGWLGDDGWNRCVDDLRLIGETLRARHPDMPLVLLGHSMGAMLSQRFVTRFGDRIDALVLSGTPGTSDGSHWMPALIARLIALFKGREHVSPMLQKLIFGRSNEAFGPAHGFEWLSRDPDQVRRYVDDPLCGFVLRAGSLHAMFASLGDTARRVTEVPACLPVYVLAGTDDPVHGGLAGITRLLQDYAAQGIGFDARLFPGGRHEMFNETNRDEVFEELLHWLERTLHRR